jgi:cob(I)alamin adenosyltransferase
VSDSTSSASAPRFQNPERVAINRVYTRKGDTGTTSLVGGQKVDKFDLRIDTYGTVDELNAFVGAARQTLDEIIGRTLAEAPANDPTLQEWDRLGRALVRIQHQLFNLGSLLATLPEDLHPRQPRPVEDDITWLESEMDRANDHLEPLRSFVLPGGGRLNVEFHQCRTICRRAERLATHLARETEVDPIAITYLNRLSDAFFVWSRYACQLVGVPELLWQPNRASESVEP